MPRTLRNIGVRYHVNCANPCYWAGFFAASIRP